MVIFGSFRSQSGFHAPLRSFPEGFLKKGRSVPKMNKFGLYYVKYVATRGLSSMGVPNFMKSYL